MCDDVQKELDGLKVSNDTRKGFNMLIRQVSKINKRLDNIDKRQTEQEARASTMQETINQVLTLVNDINNKISLNKMDESAAQMGLIKSIFTTRAGWVAMGIVLLAIASIGITVAYIIEHSTAVSTIVSAVN